MGKRVYKFTSAEYGISNLKTRRLKLSTIDDLNDPFDLCAIDTTDPIMEKVLEANVINFRGRIGLLCFSRNWDNLLLWSHYAASHTGLCLGFDAPDGPPGDGYDLDVHYQPSLLQVSAPSDVNQDLIIRMFRTKHECWSHEQEVRLFVKLNDPPDMKGLWWFDFGPNLELKEVIVGSQCSAKNLKAIAGTLKDYGEAVRCTWAYMRKDAFLLVQHDFPPPWLSSSSVKERP
jgi:Protein of unknown function (DUF2971)